MESQYSHLVPPASRSLPDSRVLVEVLAFADFPPVVREARLGGIDVDFVLGVCDREATHEERVELEPLLSEFVAEALQELLPEITAVWVDLFREFGSIFCADPELDLERLVRADLDQVHGERGALDRHLLFGGDGVGLTVRDRGSGEKSERHPCDRTEAACGAFAGHRGWIQQRCLKHHLGPPPCGRAFAKDWDLYREKGVNPLSGCFPMLIQMPFLIGMFDLLKSTFELRGQEFIPGWIDNLTAPDVLFSWGVSLPLIGNEFHLLPVLLGVAMYVQQKMSSNAPKDPALWTEQQRQQKTMGSMMTILFTVLFYKFPAGLNIYWLASLIFGILQQWLTAKLLSDAPTVTVLPDPKKPSKGKNRQARQATS